jgi:hypothetical protein
MEGPADGRRRQPSRKRKAHTGVRVRSSLPPPMEGDAGVARRPVATRVVAPAMRFDSSTFRQALSVQLEWTPACRAGDHGFESRTERSAVVAAGCQSGLSIRAARVRSPSTAHHACPHGLEVQDARFSAGRTPVRVRLGVPMLSWRNRQTHRLQVAAPPWHVGSTPTESTREGTPTCRNGRRAALRARCPSGREGSTPSVGTSGRGQESRLALQARRPGFDTPPLHQPTRRRTRVRG